MKKGDTVYLRPVKLGNAYRRDNKIKEGIVKSVGRKYVEVEYYGKFNIKGGIQKTEFSADYKLYESIDDLNIVIESEELSHKIINSIPKYGDWDISIDKLRQIAKILEL